MRTQNEIEQKLLKLLEALIYPELMRRLSGIGREIIIDCEILKIPVERAEQLFGTKIADEILKLVKNDLETAKLFREDILAQKR